MKEIDKLKSKINSSKKGDYSVSENNGEKNYTIKSEELKKTLRDSISTQNWDSKQAVGTNVTEYSIDEDGEFALYRKDDSENSDDEFVFVPKGTTSSKRDKFLESRKKNKDSRDEVKRSREEAKESREGFKKKSDTSKGDRVSFKPKINENGELVTEKDGEQFADQNSKKEFEESWGGKTAEEFSKMSQPQQQQSQQEEKSNLPFWKNWRNQ